MSVVFSENARRTLHQELDRLITHLESSEDVDIIGVLELVLENYTAAQEDEEVSARLRSHVELAVFDAIEPNDPLCPWAENAINQGLEPVAYLSVEECFDDYLEQETAFSTTNPQLFATITLDERRVEWS